MGRLTTAMVLGGGGARGAYETGVISYLRDELEPELGRELKLDILSGTSVGALHACFLAATAHQPSDQARLLREHWLSMKLEEVLRLGYADIFRFIREIFGKASPHPVRHGGLVDPRGLRAIVGNQIPWLAIGRNIRRSIVHALTVSATDVATGRTLVFVQRAGGGLPAWGKDPHFQATACTIGPKHALASAAIPLLFPAVRLRGRLFVDGGLRLNVPLSPALRMGARRVIVVSLRSEQVQPPVVDLKWESDKVLDIPTGPILFGKTLNALLVDRTDQDLDRLRRLNSLLEAGTRAYGANFAQTLNEALIPHRNQSVRYVRTLLVRPSKDMGALAMEYARSAEFRRRRSLAHRALLSLVDRGADLASYLLFDRGFADILIEMGRADARARKAEWLKFWSESPESNSEAAEMERDVSAA